MRPGVNMSSMFRKGPWTPEEDMLLKNYIQKYGQGKWHLVALKAGLNRCRKSCRLRWLNYLSPSIKRGDFQEDEVDLMLRLHKLLGNRWSLIAGRIPGRTANDVKNYWNTHFRSRSNRHKQELKDGKPSQHATVSAIRPQTHTLSKTSNMHPHIEPLNTDNLITSSKDSFSKAFNDSSGLVSSPVVTDDMINDYMDELFEDPEKEIGDKVGSSLQGFSLEGEDLDGVEQDDWKNRWSDILMDDAIWDLLHSEMRNTNQWYQIVGIQQPNQHTHDHHILDCEASDNSRRLEEKLGAYECHLL